MQFKRICFALAILLLLFSSSISYSRYHSSRKHTVHATWCSAPGYTCLRVRDGDTWYSLFPDDYERGMVMRINFTNGSLYPGRVLKVPLNLEHSNILEHAPLPNNIPAPGEKIVVFDPKIHAWGAYDGDGILIRWGPASGGKDYCNDIQQPCRTKSGIFRIFLMGESNCVSSKFPIPDGGAPMPFCMFFNGDQALHGSPGGVERANVSHGCVRLFVSDAEWLRYDFIEGPTAANKYRGTKVIVLSY